MEKKRPNILFILADDLGWGDLGCSGNSLVKTPNLDRLAREGTCLANHYSASPICAPARAGLLTGRYPHRTGAVDVPSNRGLDRIHLSEQTLADVFAGAGYRTGLVGKWHNGIHDPRYHPLARGFQHFSGFLNGGMDYYDWVLEREGEPMEADGRYLTDVFTEAGCRFMERGGDSPFFLMVAYNAPHSPLQAPEARIEPYRAAGSLSEEVATLYAMIEEMDAGVGRLLQFLADSGMEEDTLVVFTSDNGPFLGGACNRYNGSLRGEKGSIYEGGIHVPCLVRQPGRIPPGKDVDAVTHFCDWLPTLAGFCGIDPAPPHPLDGVDISGLLRGGTADLPERRFWQRNRYAPLARCNGAVREGPWKLVFPMRAGGDAKSELDTEVYLQGLHARAADGPLDPPFEEREVEPVRPTELYHLESDPAESRDLSAEAPERRAALEAAWDEWFRDVTRRWKAVYRENREGGPQG